MVPDIFGRVFRGKPLKLQRMASAVMVEMVLYSHNSCRLLGKIPGAPTLFGTFMSGCGDFATQLDLAEVLYR